MQRPQGKSPQSIINNNAYVDEDLSDNESDTNALHARALAAHKSYEADHITVDIENDVPEGQFFDKYEFDDYETDDYEVVNFEINSPDIEAFEGLDSSSQSAFQERLKISLFLSNFKNISRILRLLNFEKSAFIGQLSILIFFIISRL